MGCRVDDQLKRADPSDSGPVVVVRQAIQARRQRCRVVPVPVIVRPLKVSTEIVDLPFFGGELKCREWIAAQS